MMKKERKVETKMCMTKSNIRTREFLKKHQNKKEVVVWKVYLVDHKTRVHSPYTGGCRIKFGTIKSNRKRKPVQTYDRIVIHRGIHVYLTRAEARANSLYGIRQVFKCTAKLEDLVGIDPWGSQGVFMKIHIPEKDFEKGKKGRN